MFPLPLTWSKQLIPHPNTKKIRKLHSKCASTIHSLVAFCFQLLRFIYKIFILAKTSSGSISSYNMKHTLKNTKTCWQMLMAQNSARNMPMAETWHRLGVMFHKLKQTDNTSLLAKTWTVVKHLRLGNNLGGGASPVALSIWARQDNFSNPSFSHLLFSNPTHKTETRNANRWETTSSNPLDQSETRRNQ
jgi:hypothetical protein